MKNNNFYLEKENNNEEIQKKTNIATSSDLSYQISNLNQKITLLENKIENNSSKICDVTESVKKNFLQISGGQLSGNLNLNKNSILDLTTPEQAGPFVAANVGFVMNQVNKILTKIDNMESTISTYTTEVDNIKETINQFEILSHKTIFNNEQPAQNIDTQINTQNDLDMHSHYIRGLLTPENKDLDYAANVAFVKACVDPISGQLLALTQQVDSNTKSLCNIQLNFLPTTGGFIYGTINMQNNKLTGLKSPSNPSDAVNLEYLNQILGNSNQTINSTISTKNNLLYSTNPNYHVSSPLPRPLIKSGYSGWSWPLSSSYSGGYYNWSNLSFEQTHPESQSFEFSQENPHELLLKKPGEYTLSFSLVALIPANTNQCYPSIQLNIEEDFSQWGQRNKIFIPSSSKAMTLTIKDRVSILGVFYDIVELPPLSPQVNTRIIISPKQKYCSISLQNTNFKCNEASSLYVVQNHVSISWLPF